MQQLHVCSNLFWLWESWQWGQGFFLVLWLALGNPLLMLDCSAPPEKGGKGSGTYGSLICHTFLMPMEGLPFLSKYRERVDWWKRKVGGIWRRRERKCCGQDVKYINLFKNKKGWMAAHDCNSSVKEAETGGSPGAHCQLFLNWWAVGSVHSPFSKTKIGGHLVWPLAFTRMYTRAYIH